jgi:hypothetical protein
MVSGLTVRLMSLIGEILKTSGCQMRSDGLEAKKMKFSRRCVDGKRTTAQHQNDCGVQDFTDGWMTRATGSYHF